MEIENWNNGPKSLPMYSLDGKLVADLDMRQPLAQVNEYYYLNGSQVARRYRTNVVGSAWTVRYVHTDSLGSGVVETRPDASIDSATKYKPYGEPTLGNYKQGPGFTGHVTDVATGLSYMQQRYYDPSIGRFLSVDPVAADPVAGANFNRYWYATNNPLKFKDPDGRYFSFGGDFVFAAQALLSMGRVAATNPELYRRFVVMANSPLEHRIQPVGEDQDPEAVNPHDPKSAATGKLDDVGARTPGKGSATIMFWDPEHTQNSEGGDPRSGTPDGQMAHDMFGHGYDADQGLDDGTINPETGQPVREDRAQDIERMYLDGLEAQQKQTE